MPNTQYLTYDEYQNRGGTLPQNAFVLLEFKCRKRIDCLTDSRVQNMTEVPESVKLCMLSLMNLEKEVGAEAQAAKPVVTSFSTDGYSESYGNAMSTEDAEKSMYSIIRTMLYGELDDNGVPLLYRGVYGY
jgi:hypothetical protein